MNLLFFPNCLCHSCCLQVLSRTTKPFSFTPEAAIVGSFMILKEALSREAVGGTESCMLRPGKLAIERMHNGSRVCAPERGDACVLPCMLYNKPDCRGTSWST